MRYHFTPIRIRQYRISDLDNLNTLSVGASVGRTVLGNVLSISGKDTHPLDLVIPLISSNSRESVALVPSKMFPAELLVIAKFGNLNHSSAGENK